MLSNVVIAPNNGNVQTIEIALFPLQIFLLPGEQTELHIFEDRYRQLLIDCAGEHDVFGIPFANRNRLEAMGTLVRVQDVLQRHENGSSDIRIEAIRNFHLRSFHERLGEKLYPGGKVNFLAVDAQSEPGDELNDLMSELFELRGKPTEEKPRSLLGIARYLHLSASDKLLYCSLKNSKLRNIMLTAQVRYQLLLDRQQRSMQGNFFLN